jgi:hypothetical protein
LAVGLLGNPCYPGLCLFWIQCSLLPLNEIRATVYVRGKKYRKTSGLLPLLSMYYTSPIMFIGRNYNNTLVHLLDLTEI